ncbi:hypothetical protein ACIRP7_34545 [Streptomyces sp. NPDC102270]|uniref:hypothetical protein n=1 Tax=Streptomyces sp. NPDC102270 TaxID=3366150 RepID=UPI0038047B14
MQPVLTAAVAHLTRSRAGSRHIAHTVSSGTVRLVMANDGVVPPAAGLPGGHGPAGLGARLAEFDLVAEVPPRPSER